MDSQTNPDEAFVVSYHDQPTAFIQEDGFILYPADRPKELAFRVAPIVSQVWEMERAYQEAPPMNVHSVSEYRKLLEYNRHVLAARYDGEGEFRFVTWEINAERTGLALGHYFYQNEYGKAKEDFLSRSGLAEKTTFIGPHELSVIRAALLYRGAQDRDMGVEEREDIDRLLHQIDARLLPIDELLLEAEKEADRER
ncbi:hypothetical protein [Paenibacillus sp. S150]|uniref:hypothetical protein n=1 Tax=Paenibacillus sp. S150 TaxID=2749826 RepID=UPI001C5928ED|nr:hypothetical protein [Paenibacillus sp. S150]MBW4085244.1 hypothetical protein [Paenibacillus sp. S150]